jgi:F0F1-type ATP synthase membrane subunit b/b'
MRRAVLVLALGMAFASYVLPQESAGAAGAKQETAQGDPWIWWKWVNFLILAGGLGYLISKNAPAMFQARSEEIQKMFADASTIKADADTQAAAIELRLKNLQAEIENLRQTARAEMAAQGERFRRETEQHLARIQEQSVQEIQLMTRAARAELRKYSADLAIGLAEQRIQARLTPEVQQALADGFLADLRSRAPAVART